MRGAVLLVVWVAGCSSSEIGLYRRVTNDASPGVSNETGGAPAGCTRDTDCKGIRICENGRCVTPSNGGTNGGGGTNGSGETNGSGGTTSDTGGTSMTGGFGTGTGGTILFPTGGASGVSSNGGTTGAGGSSGTTGGFAGVGSTGGNSSTCPTGQKSCGGVCSAPSPGIGCDSSSCTPCQLPPPQHGVLACGSNGTCDFVCLSGYAKSGSSCVSSFGAGGAGGSTGSCILAQCPSCGPIEGPGCCIPNDGGCGCLLKFIPGTCH